MLDSAERRRNFKKYLVRTSLCGGHNLSHLFGIVLTDLPKYGEDQSPDYKANNCPYVLLFNSRKIYIFAVKFISKD